LLNQALIYLAHGSGASARFEIFAKGNYSKSLVPLIEKEPNKILNTSIKAFRDNILIGFDETTNTLQDFNRRVQKGGSNINFEMPEQYGTFATPVTSNLTLVQNTKSVIGVTQRIYHRRASFSLPANSVIVSGSYSGGNKNLLEITYSEINRFEIRIINLL
jgi:hypothetical protein